MKVRWCSRRLAVVAGAALAIGACDARSQAPVVADQTVTIDEDTAATIPVVASARDPNGDPLIVTAVRAPGHTATHDDTTLSVVPARDFHGSIDVRYVVSDGTYFVAAHVTLVVRPVNDEPVAEDMSQQIHGPAALMLSASDVDGDALGYEIISGPRHGRVKGATPDAEYIPDRGFIGDDEIVYRAHDAATASAPAALHLHVSPGAGPSAAPAIVQVVEDTPAAVALQGADPDHNALTFTLRTRPAHGQLGGTAPNLVYTPAPNFHGDDALTFSVDNGYAASPIATITLHVAPVNDAPVADPQIVRATEDTARPIFLTGSDVEGTPLDFAIQTGPRHGALSGAGAKQTYTPAPNFHGTDSFTFTASDGVATSAPATVTIIVMSVEDGPVATPLAVAATEDTPVTVTLTGTDGDGDALAFAVARPPAHGKLSGTPPDLIYTPAAEFSGSDSFTFTAASRGAISAPATVSIQVAAVNDPPVAVDSTVTTPEDTPVAIRLAASDVDSAALTYLVTQLPSDGTLTGSGADRVYLPASDATGWRSLMFEVSDGQRVARATVHVVITPVNDDPVARDDFAYTNTGAPITVDVVGNDRDVDGDALTVAAAGPAAHGTVVPRGRTLVYAPDAEFTGVEDIPYTVSDGRGGSATAHAIIGVGEFPPGAPDELPLELGGPASSVTAERAPAISHDGRYVAFSSPLAMAAGDENGVADIYVYDRVTGTRALASVSSTGGPGNGPSVRPRISADGRYVVFESLANNLVSGDDNGVADVFRHDMTSGETLRISVATTGAQGSGDSIDAAISDDGNLVVFSSLAFELCPDDTNGASDVFLRDVAAGTTTRLSVGAAGGEGDAPASEPRISGDGRYVAFTSLASNLVSDDTNGVTDVFVRDRIAGTLARASVSSTGIQADRAAFGPVISQGGRFVSFLSDATSLAPGPTAGVRVYTRNARASITTRAEVAGSAIAASLSGDGRYLAIAGDGMVVFDRFAGVPITPLSRQVAWPAVSGNGRYVALIDTALGVVRLRIDRLPP